MIDRKEKEVFSPYLPFFPERKRTPFKNKTSLKGLLNKVVDPIEWITEGKYKSEGFKLFDDVGQIYELQLAKMEFSTLGEDLSTFKRRTAYFEEVAGEKSDHFYLSNVKGKGQIGHSNQYLTHWFYPYKGKFHGQMIKAMINFIGAAKGDIVLDPFTGSGTTLIEASILGIKSYGIEINPALSIVSQIKADALTIEYPQFSSEIRGNVLSKIFNYFQKAGHHLQAKRWQLDLNQRKNAKELLEEAWDIHLPPSFIHKLPFKWRNLLLLIYLHALSDFTYLKGTNKQRSLEEFFMINFYEYLETLRNTHFVLHKLNIQPEPPTIFLASALELPIEPNSVKGIITSPPYSIALDYVRNDLHLLNYLGIDTSSLREEMVGLKGKKSEKLQLYERDIKKSIEEMYRVLTPGGWAVVVLGDVVINGGRTDFCDKIIKWAPQMGFSDACAMKRPILGGFARLRYEYIIFLQK